MLDYFMKDKREEREYMNKYSKPVLSVLAFSADERFAAVVCEKKYVRTFIQYDGVDVEPSDPLFSGPPPQEGMVPFHTLICEWRADPMS